MVMGSLTQAWLGSLPATQDLGGGQRSPLMLEGGSRQL